MEMLIQTIPDDFKKDQLCTSWEHENDNSVKVAERAQVRIINTHDRRAFKSL